VNASAILLAISCFAQTRPIQETAQSIFKTSGAPHGALLVIQDDKTYFEGYGNAKQDSLVRIGSISKVLNASVMVKLASQGKLKLEDPLQRYAPAGTSLPQPITLFHLATHTSGLPRSFNFKTRWSSFPNTVPGNSALYSNLAFVLLAEAQAKATNTPYHELLESQITKPLGLKDTTPAPSASQCARLLSDPPCTTDFPLAGTASVYSTPHDMGIWLKHLILNKALHKTYIQRESLKSAEGLDSAGYAKAIGLGWIEPKTQTRILEKTGGHDGFLTYIAFTPNGRTGVFAVITTMDLEASRRMAARVNELIEELNKQ
jgi:D-alanyl-D-alanine-carboxypeptidase/D-alanyl-D-alanine-endopeptidase